MNSHIEEHKNEQPIFKGHYKFTLEDVTTGEIEIHEYDNLITTAGFALILDNLTSPAPANNILLNKAVLGNGTNPPNIADTQLQNETYRNDIFSRNSVGNVGYITAAFTMTEFVGTIREAGMVANGGAAANTGVLFSHVATNITKTNTQTLTLDFTLTLANA
jgi:hypothetical protein